MPLFASRVFLAIPSNSLDSVIKFNDKGIAGWKISSPLFVDLTRLISFPFVIPRYISKSMRKVLNISSNYGEKEREEEGSFQFKNRILEIILRIFAWKRIEGSGDGQSTCLIHVFRRPDNRPIPLLLAGWRMRVNNELVPRMKCSAKGPVLETPWVERRGLKNRAKGNSDSGGKRSVFVPSS